MQCIRGTRMEKRCNVENLRIRQRHCGHALVRPALVYHLADLLALHVVCHQRRTHQIGSASARGVRAMAKPAGLLELLASAIRSRFVISATLWPGRQILYADYRSEYGPQSYEFHCSPVPWKFTPAHSLPRWHVF